MRNGTKVNISPLSLLERIRFYVSNYMQGFDAVGWAAGRASGL